MFLVGLTGGIAAGKSTVAAMLSERGAAVIDADQVAREVVEPGTVGLQKVIEEFGDSLLDSSGHLDRKTLADVIFADSTKRERLEKILHPLIRTRTIQLIEQQSKPVVVYAVPLLVEANVDYPFDLVVTVEAGESEQLKRLTRDRGYSEQQARQRITAQASKSEREASADFVLDSSGPIEAMAPQIEKLWALIQTKLASGQ